MNDKWGSRITEKFIEVYKYHECLWNVKHELYKNREARDLAYNNIIHQMASSLDVHMSLKSVKEKIRSLRNTFINEIRKINESKMNGGAVYVPRLKWFESMLFLRPADDMRPLRDSTVSQNETSITITRIPENESVTITKLPENESSSSNFSAESAPVLSITEITSIPRNILPARPIQQETHIHHSLPPFPTLEPLKNNSPQIFEEDEFDAFGRNVALQLKNLPLIHALESQEIIQRILKEQRIKALHGHSNLSMRDETKDNFIHSELTPDIINIENPSEIKPIINFKIEMD